MLIPGFQLCLAHYCDQHGPTPLMVTEGLSVTCNLCNDSGDQDSASLYSRPQSRAQTPTSSFPLPDTADTPRRAVHNGFLSGGHNNFSTQSGFLPVVEPTTYSPSAIETPPDSPGRSFDHLDFRSSAPSLARERQPYRSSSFRKTYDDSVTKRIKPCESCDLTLPQRPGTPRRSGSPDDCGPTLRTRAAYARVRGGGHQFQESSPPSPITSSSSVSEDEKHFPGQPAHRRSGTITSTTSRSSSSSYSKSNSHVHYLDYTSTHEPLQAATFTSVRASCLRTLSLETLPRPPGLSSAPQGFLTTPGSSQNGSAFVTPQMAGSAASGGPIFFGDPNAGYTTAFIFRIPDVHARGHKRMYAFLALTKHRERQAMKAFPLLSDAFREMSAWIQALAEAEAERTLSDPGTSSPLSLRSAYSTSGIAQRMQTPDSSASTPSLAGSSFLAAGSSGFARRAAGGFGGSGVAVKQRSLAELVGLPDFFIQLHARFVRLLVDIGLEIGQ
jgi:hypothetical protein